MPYQVEFTPSALRDLRRLPPRIRDTMEEAIQDLARNPRPAGVRKLKGEEFAWRVRVGPYRLVYDIYDDTKTIVILKVVRRSETTYRL